MEHFIFQPLSVNGVWKSQLEGLTPLPFLWGVTGRPSLFCHCELLCSLLSPTPAEMSLFRVSDAGRAHCSKDAALAGTVPVPFHTDARRLCLQRLAAPVFLESMFPYRLFIYQYLMEL